jgi:hypothetical protein
MIRVLIGCERSGVVRRAFRKFKNVHAVSCDLVPADDGSPHHHVGDVLEIIDDGWDIGIFFPTCTFLCVSGMHWTTRGFRDPQLTEDALAFVSSLLNCGIPRTALENPRGIISTRIRRPDQEIQPYNFGEDASKTTGLWLKNLPPLRMTKYIKPRIVIKDGKEYKRWANQTDSGQNRLGPSDTRSVERSNTYPGIAEAMAAQWLEHIL